MIAFVVSERTARRPVWLARMKKEVVGGNAEESDKNQVTKSLLGAGTSGASDGDNCQSPLQVGRVVSE